MRSFKEFLAEELRPIGERLGSNPGGVHHDTKTGEKFYIKQYHNPEQAKAEVLAGKIYKHMGIHTLEPEMHGDSGVKTKWNEHVETKHRSFYDKPSKKHAEQLGKMYHAAILTKNWDVVGLEHDNIVHNRKTGDLHMIDHGGAFHFRAQGGHKDYGPDIQEKKSLRNSSLPSGHVFNSAFSAHPHAEKHGLEAVRKMDDNHIHHLFRTSGLKNWKEMHQNFQARKKSLLNAYSS